MLTNADISKITEVIGILETQLRFVANSPSSTGLIKCGSAESPFDNQIRKDKGLYKLYNSNIHEKITKQKARENSMEE